MKCPEDHIEIYVENGSGTKWYCEICEKSYRIEDMEWTDVDR